MSSEHSAEADALEGGNRTDEGDRRPDVSVLIVGWRKAPHLRDCIQRLVSRPTALQIEVVVSLNEPTDTAREVAASLGVKATESSSNLGFAAACNRAADLATGELLMLLNDDVQTDGKALETLAATISRHPDAAAVGCKLLYPDGELQEAGAVVWSDGSVFQLSHLVRPDADLTERLRTCDYCSAAALLVRHDAWRAVGGMDEGYFPAYYEDVDLCFKLAAKGGKILYEPTAVARHPMGSSTTFRYRQFLVEHNRRRLVERWSERLSAQPSRPEPFTAQAVCAAIERAASGTTGPPTPAMLRDVRLPRRSPASILRRERELSGLYAQHLERALDEVERDLQELREMVDGLMTDQRELQTQVAQRDEVVGLLDDAIKLRDGMLAQFELQLEEQARENHRLQTELTALRSSRTHRASAAAAGALRKNPRLEAAARKAARRLVP